MVQEQKEYNILLLGESQSGKSTLVEFLTSYADPKYTIEQKYIGDGIFSKTEVVRTKIIQTDLPSYFVADKITGDRVDYGIFLEDSQEDYADELNDRKKYILEQGEPTAAMATFNLIDTPGLNDTSKFDENNLAIIFKALEDVTSIHLVVITVSSNPFTEGLQNALKAYINFLPELNGNIVFLHTRIDYSKLHHEERQFVSAFKEKKMLLHKLAGRDSVPHLLIDNDINSTRTIRHCMTKNTLRELLAMAKLNQVVPLQIMVLNKTAKMRIVDHILKDKFEESIAARERTLGDKDQAQKAVLATIGELKAKIAHYEQVLEDIGRDWNFRTRDLLHLLHEERYEQNWRWLKLTEPMIHMCYPSEKLVASPTFIPHIIDYVATWAHNVVVLSEKDGKNHKRWSAKLHRNRFQNGTFHVKIYIKMKKHFAAVIEKLNTEDNKTRGELAICMQDLETYKRVSEEDLRTIESLMVDLRLDRYLLGRVSMSRLENRVFHALVEAKVYVHQDSESAANLEAFYKANRDNLAELYSNEKYIGAEPVNNTETSNDGSGTI
ncbi:hypothetical protein BGZ52_000928 [Haplosporangium bisporale]|nr:hypothetical protein BGZ52_000928 [Haplosporangium bisporale]